MKKIVTAACVLVAVSSTTPAFAEALPTLTGQFMTVQGEKVSGIEINFRDVKTRQITMFKVDSQGQFIGQLPSLGDYSVFLSSSTNCLSANFPYTVSSSGQKLAITLPRKSQYSFSAVDEKSKIVSGVSFTLSANLEDVSNPEIGNPKFRCSQTFRTNQYVLATEPLIFNGFALDVKSTSLGTYTFQNAYSQTITSAISAQDLKDGKVTVKLEKTPALLLNTKNLKFTKYTLNGTAEVELPADFGQTTTEKVFRMFLRGYSQGKWGRWFYTRTLKASTGSVTKFSTNLAAYKGSLVEVGFIGNDFSMAATIARVKVPK